MESISITKLAGLETMVKKFREGSSLVILMQLPEQGKGQ